MLEKHSAHATRYRLLLVDDDATVLRGLAAALEFDFEVVPCHSAEHALVLLASDEFHAVCSDYSMPGMNGLELFECIARLPCDVACLLLTGSSSFMGQQSTGDQYVITKPVDPARLSGLLTRLVQTAQAKSQADRVPLAR